MTFSPELEAKFKKLITHYPEGRQRAALIPMLMFAQDEVGVITKEVIGEVAGRLGITPLQVDEVISYYTMLRKKPEGKHHIQICTNVSCMLMGGAELYEHAKKKLELENGQTSADELISIEEVECMGACSWAPAIQVGYDFHHNMTPEKLDRLIEDLRKVR